MWLGSVKNLFGKIMKSIQWPFFKMAPLKLHVLSIFLNFSENGLCEYFCINMKVAYNVIIDTLYSKIRLSKAEILTLKAV